MSKKEIVLIFVVLLLGGVYVYFFTNFLEKPTIQILAQIRPGSSRNRSSRDARSSVDPVSFTLDGKYELTSIKVVADGEYQTNKYAHALWHLVSESNSVATKGIIYGMRIKGMESDIAKARPEPLQPNTPYRLLLEAGKYKGETVFKTRETVHAAAQ
jgi:hypothetical protein